MQQVTKYSLPEEPDVQAYYRCFSPPEGYAWIKGDMSQVELRIAAEIARDPRMIEAYKRGEDLHRLSASMILEKPLDQVTGSDRQIAKSLNFGLLYGAGAATLRNYALKTFKVVLSEAEAKRFRYKFFQIYRGLYDWHQQVGQLPTPALVTTLGGRQRANVMLFTEKANTPVQGTGADMTKAAMGELWRDRGRFSDVQFALTVHDDISIFVPIEEAEEAKLWMKEKMEAAGSQYLHSIPVVADVKVGKNWAGEPLTQGVS